MNDAAAAPKNILSVRIESSDKGPGSAVTLTIGVGVIIVDTSFDIFENLIDILCSGAVACEMLSDVLLGWIFTEAVLEEEEIEIDKF